MAQYIPKEPLVAKIRRLDALYHTSKDLSGDLFIQGLFCFLYTLEMKEVDTEQLDKLLDWWKEVTTDYSAYKVKEVDLDEEIENYFKGFGKFASVGIDDCIDIAKYFFELGLKAQKGE